MDITQALRDTENSLRDFIASVLEHLHGADWVDQCGVTPNRINQWKQRKETEEKQLTSGVSDERLIYYADFYDLKTILQKNWSGEFLDALGDWKTIEVWLTEIEKLRNPDAHRRELLPHQKHLILGIAGEIRTRIIRYRSKRDTSEDCFPRIESARDSLGNIWTPDEKSGRFKTVPTKSMLRPGNIVDFVITARDPDELPLKYALKFDGMLYSEVKWQSSSSFSLRVMETHIAESFGIDLMILSPRQYHALGASGYDDAVRFLYKVLPLKITP